jgi:hypothetical protein
MTKKAACFQAARADYWAPVWIAPESGASKNHPADAPSNPFEPFL